MINTPYMCADLSRDRGWLFQEGFSEEVTLGQTFKGLAGVIRGRRSGVPFGARLEQMVRIGFGWTKRQGREAAGEEQETGPD